MRIAIQADYKWKLYVPAFSKAYLILFWYSGSSSDQGKAGILVWGGDFGVIVLLGEKDGKPTVYAPPPPTVGVDPRKDTRIITRIKGSVFVVAGVHIVLSGHDTWIFNWLQGIIQDIVKDELESQVPAAVVKAIQTKACTHSLPHAILTS